MRNKRPFRDTAGARVHHLSGLRSFAKLEALHDVDVRMEPRARRKRCENIVVSKRIFKHTFSSRLPSTISRGSCCGGGSDQGCLLIEVMLTHSVVSLLIALTKVPKTGIFLDFLCHRSQLLRLKVKEVRHPVPTH